MRELYKSKDKYLILDKIFNIYVYVPFALVWSTFCYSMTFSWYVGGFIMLISPIYGLFVFLYQTIINKKKLMKPFGYLVVVYIVYILGIHVFHGDFMSHGVGDIVIFMFLLVLSLEYNHEELFNMLKIVTASMLYLTLCYGILSIIFTYCITPSLLSGLNEDSFIYKSISRWTMQYGYRMIGVGGNSNSTGHWMAYGFILSTMRLFLGNTNSLYKFLHFLLFCLTSIILVLTGCRAAMIVFGLFLIGGFLVYLFYSRKNLDAATRKYISGLIFMFFIAFLLFIVMIACKPVLISKILDIMRVQYNPEMTLNEIVNNIINSLYQGSGRDELRKYAVEKWRENKFWGVPTTEIVKPFEEIASKTGCHNVFLQVLATAGIPGFILHISLWILSLYYSFKALLINKNKMVKDVSMLNIVFIISIFVDNLFETYLYTSVTIMGFIGFLSLAVGALLCVERE